MTTLEILQSIRTRVARGWTQKAMARDADGLPCDPEHPEACSWCVFGAGIATGAAQAERLAAYQVLLSQCEGRRNPVDWINDFPGRTQQQILDWIDRGIASLQAGPS